MGAHIIRDRWIQLHLLACLALSAACTPNPEDRFLAQADLGHVTLCGGKLEVYVDPGTDPTADDEGCGFRFWASAPTPIVYLTNRQTEPLDVRVSIDNIFPDGELVPELSFVEYSAGCPDSGGVSTVLLAPLEVATEEGTRITTLTLPPCTHTTLRALPPIGMGNCDGVIRIAVIGEIQGNVNTFETARDQIEAWPADVVFVVGNLANSPEQYQLETWREMFQETDVPFVVALGREEAQGSAFLPFHQVFGRSDYTFTIGGTRFFVIDTASAVMSEAQFSYWEQTFNQAVEPIRSAFMHIPPFDPAGLRDNGFESRAQAGRFLSLLGDGGVRAVFTGGIGSYERSTLGGIVFHSTGGGGRSIEALSDYDHHYLQMTVIPGGSACGDGEENEEVPMSVDVEVVPIEG